MPKRLYRGSNSSKGALLSLDEGLPTFTRPYQCTHTLAPYMLLAPCSSRTCSTSRFTWLSRCFLSAFSRRSLPRRGSCCLCSKVGPVPLPPDPLTMAGRAGLEGAPRSIDPRLRVVEDLARPPRLRGADGGRGLLAAAASWREGPENRSAKLTAALPRLAALFASPPDAASAFSKPRSCIYLTSSELMPSCLELRC